MNQKNNTDDLKMVEIYEKYFDLTDKQKQDDDLKLIFTYARLFECLINNELDSNFIYRLLPYKDAKIVDDYCKKVKQSYLDDIDKVKKSLI